jgi:hypothetical protein
MDSIDGLAVIKKAREHVNKDELQNTLMKMKLRIVYINSLYEILASQDN